MAHNNAPEVAFARNFARQFKARRVVILFETEDDKIGYASYGTTASLCAETKGLADRLYEEMQQWYRRPPA